LYTNNVNRLYINTSGNIGIGTTSPGYKLDVQGNSGLITINTNGLLSAGGQIISGTGEFASISSGTDLNFRAGATHLMVLKTTGCVGIGTTAPASMLHIYGSGNTFTRYTNTTSAGHYIDIGANSAGESFVYGYGAYPLLFGTNATERMRITSGGNVGIGTTNPSNGKLQVNGRIYTVGTAGTANAIFQGGQLEFYKDATPTYAASIGLSGPSSGGTNDIVFETYGGTWSERMRIATGGNVGIGTTTPSVALHIARTAAVSPSIRLQTTDSTTNGSIQWTNSGNSVLAFIGSNSNISDGSGNLEFATGGTTTRMVINSGGNVGIGTTNPTAKLWIEGNDIILNTEGSAQGKSLYFRYSDGATIQSDSYLKFNTGGSPTEKMRITSGGNVGIGTTNPVADGLTIRREGSDKRTLLQLDRPNTAGLQTNIRFTVSDIMVGQIQHEYVASNYNHMSFTLRSPGGSDTIPLWLENSGNVGIGTTSPAFPLHVARSSGDSVIVVDSGASANAQFRFQEAGLVRAAITYVSSDSSVRFYNSGDRFTILSNGNLGVGVMTPAAKLQVSGSSNVLNVRGSGSATTSSIFSVDGNNGRLFEVSDDLSNSLFSVNTIAGLPVIEAFADYTVTMGTYGAYTLQVTGSRVGVGTSSPGYPLHVSGSVSGISIYATNDIAAFSDQSVKTDLQVIDSAVDRIKQINGYTYVRVDDLSNTRRAGVIAQEVQKVLPEVVSENNDGTLNVAYSNMIALLIEGMKEQQSQIDKLREDLEDLRYEL
jgi:hypothetical protein